MTEIVKLWKQDKMPNDNARNDYNPDCKLFSLGLGPSHLFSAQPITDVFNSNCQLFILIMTDY